MRAFGSLPTTSLEDLVPADHVSRHLEHSLDLAFVRDLAQASSAGIGQPSIDPVVFFKRQLVMFFEGLRSERPLLRVAADRLSLRWYLGYSLADALPDHSSRIRICDCCELAVFRRFFEVITEQCARADLIWGCEQSIDSTNVEADAALASLQTRFAASPRNEHLEPPAETPAQEVGLDAPVGVPARLKEAARAQLAERAAARHEWFGAAGRPNRDETSGAYRRTVDFRVSATDPDATPMPLGDGRMRLGSQDHDVVDGGMARIILMALVTPAEVQDNQPALDLL